MWHILGIHFVIILKCHMTSEEKGQMWIVLTCESTVPYYAFKPSA